MFISQEVLSKSNCHFDYEVVRGEDYFTIRDPTQANVFWMYWWATVGGKAYARSAITLIGIDLTMPVMIKIHTQDLLLPPSIESALTVKLSAPLCVLPLSSLSVLLIYLGVTLAWLIWVMSAAFVPPPNNQTKTRAALQVCVDRTLRPVLGLEACSSG